MLRTCNCSISWSSLLCSSRGKPENHLPLWGLHDWSLSFLCCCSLTEHRAIWGEEKRWSLTVTELIFDPNTDCWMKILGGNASPFLECNIQKEEEGLVKTKLTWVPVLLCLKDVVSLETHSPPLVFIIFLLLTDTMTACMRSAQVQLSQSPSTEKRR